MLICIAFFAVGSALAGASQNMASRMSMKPSCAVCSQCFHSTAHDDRRPRYVTSLAV